MREREVTTEAEIGVGSHKPRNCGCHEKLKVVNKFSPAASRGSVALPNLDFGPEILFQDFNPQEL